MSKGDNGSGEAVYSISDFAARIGRSVSTLRNWDKSGLLVAKRYPSGRRFYTESQLREILGTAPSSASAPPPSTASAPPLSENQE